MTGFRKGALFMQLRSGRTDWDHLLGDLKKLQRESEVEAAKVVELGRRRRALGVAFGIKIGYISLARLKARSPAKLKALSDKWESVPANLKASGPAAESIEGIDFGIRQVISRVRRYLNQLPQPKPPTAAGTTA
jgi:hypothetical protein